MACYRCQTKGLKIFRVSCFSCAIWLYWNPGILGFFYWLYVKVIEKSKVKWNAMQWSSMCTSITVRQHSKSGNLVEICICAMCSGTQCEWHFNWTSSWIRVRMVITEFSCRVEIRSTRHSYLRSMLSLFLFSLSYSFFHHFSSSHCHSFERASTSIWNASHVRCAYINYEIRLLFTNESVCESSIRTYT